MQEIWLMEQQPIVSVHTTGLTKLVDCEDKDERSRSQVSPPLQISIFAHSCAHRESA